ncbi:MAG: molybdopterin-binding protein [Planctomycetota bacterium]
MTDPSSQTPLPTSKPQLIGEVVSIGDEMISGARVDTNTAWLSRRLGELGVSVAFHSTVGDTLEHNVEVLRNASQRADVVVCTGGLGPTRDDLTRDAFAGFIDQPLELQPDSLRRIEEMFRKRQREMPERNRIQAMFPKGSHAIINPQGTAPGIELSVPRDGRSACHFFALPGVPAEMKRMFDESVARTILAMSGASSKIRHHVMKFFGTGESDMEHRLGDMISRDRQPRVGITVSSATISLRITATAETDEQCQESIERTRQEIMRLVPEFYFGEGEHFEQQHAIDATLRGRNESVVIIELGRAAPLGDWFAGLGQTSSYRGGLSLAVPADLNHMFPAEDERTSIDRVKELMGADWVLMVDAYPELDHGSDVPLPASDVRLLIVNPEGRHFATTITLGGHPSIMQSRIAKSGMAALRKHLG